MAAGGQQGEVPPLWGFRSLRRVVSSLVAHRLHTPDVGSLDADQRALLLGGWWSLSGGLRLACGRRADGLSDPGYARRTASRRCVECCRAVGAPYGTGAPNDVREA